jgi:hypothetical protein
MALKYWKGRRVDFFVKDTLMRGWVTDNSERGILLKGVDGKAYSSKTMPGHTRYDTGTLGVEDFGVRVFDTILTDSGGNTTSRRSHAYWEEFCKASEWNFNYERIHSKSDLEYFFGSEEYPMTEQIFIFNGHGLDTGFTLSNGDVISKPDDFEVFGSNRKKILIFSSCLVGKNKALALNLKKLFDAEAIFAYTEEVSDSFCYLVESYLLTLLYSEFFYTDNFQGLKEILQITRKGTDIFRKLEMPGVSQHPLVMY